MKRDKLPLSFGTGTSVVVSKCQNCGNENLDYILFLGYLPPVNKLLPIGSNPHEQPSYPAGLLYCPVCHLAQLGLIVDPKILFPYEYPYTSGTTKVLRDNFAELYDDRRTYVSLNKDDLIIDIGSNDGTLLSNFKKNHRVLGITPEEIGKKAIKNGIPTIIDYFNKKTVDEALKKYGRAKIITAANVFAHMENVHEIIDLIKKLLVKDGVFISESHYLLSLLQTTQYDTVYHEHLRYYSLTSLTNLLKMHGFEVFHAKQIPPHGGSIRVYAARKNAYIIQPSVKKLLQYEKSKVTKNASFQDFNKKVLMSKLELLTMIYGIKKGGKKIFGISAPSRATTLINYVGLNEQIISAVVEVKGSHKIGKYVPGTLIPILDEENLFMTQPEYALLLSWHIADELMPKLVQRGFKGDFIIPLPTPKIIKGKKYR